MVSFYQLLLFLLLGIAVIVLLTARFRVHPFFALMIASLIVGAGAEIPIAEVMNAMKEGFGNVMKSLGFIIVLGTTLGVLLEQSGSTTVMANFILKKIGPKYPALAISVTGFVVGLPIFCDSGFIVLSGLNLSLARRTGTRVVVMAVSLATGLYSVHCLVPPHPGAAAAAGIIGVDYGRLILIGICIAIPAMIIGYLYATVVGNRIPVPGNNEAIANENPQRKLPTTLSAFLPVLIPIILIALKSYFIPVNEKAVGWKSLLAAIGEPSIALAIGVVLALKTISPWKTDSINKWLLEAVEKAGGILVIIGAGGAFGAVLAATNIGGHFSEVLPLASLGILFPFLLTSLLKTAQGSSTVAIITAASIILPLLPSLGLDSSDGKLLAVLSMGAGSMMISHANDAYFWVIAKFEKLEMKTMLQVYSVATVLMGLTTLLMVYILSLLL